MTWLPNRCPPSGIYLGSTETTTPSTRIRPDWRGLGHPCSRRRQPSGTLTKVPGLPQLDIARVRRWCEQRVPEHARDQVRVECDIGPRHLTIVECRPPWREGIGPEWTRFPIARLRYTQATRTWTLYWRDRNLRFHLYDQIEPSPDIGDLLLEIDRDPTAIFWG